MVPGFRHRLLRGMAAAIRERGYRDTTIADVVRHAGTSKRTFYQHFGDRQACFLALLEELNAATIEHIRAAVDPGATARDQVRQAIAAWLGALQEEPALTVCWIRETPALGADARRMEREVMERYVALIQSLADTPELRAAGIEPPPRPVVIMLLGGLRELIATTIEDGGDLNALYDLIAEKTMALLVTSPG